MDFHEDLKVPQAAIDQIAEDTKNRGSDEFGVRQVELFHNADGQAHRLLEALAADAVRRHHASIGVPCGEVHELSGLL